MADLNFSPEGIRELGRTVAEPLRSGAGLYEQHVAAAHGVTLPRIMGSGQRTINDLLLRAGRVSGVLLGMTDGFQERMYTTADAYEGVEAGNTAASSRITGEI